LLLARRCATLELQSLEHAYATLVQSAAGWATVPAKKAVEKPQRALGLRFEQ
jgi:hypothetical protein